MHIQATKPDTIGLALTTSPLGLASYILEKFSTWTKSDHSAAKSGGPFGLDDVLTNVMIYWINGNIISSQRYYKENIPNTELNQLDQFPIGNNNKHGSVHL